MIAGGGYKDKRTGDCLHLRRVIHELGGGMRDFESFQDSGDLPDEI